jgi:uncharacterized damage-inducible protein DinB
LNVSYLKEIYDYNHLVRQNYITFLQKKLEWDEMTANYNTAWLSLKDTLLHIIWAEDSWINYSINDLEDPNRPFDFSIYDSWRKIVDYNHKVVSKINSYFMHLNDKDLLKTIYRINNDGIRRKSIVRDVLLHVTTEELHHRGEIIAILWQKNIQPPDMGWLSVMKKTDPIWDMK